jgi:hypothetical protein
MVYYSFCCDGDWKTSCKPPVYAFYDPLLQTLYQDLNMAESMSKDFVTSVKHEDYESEFDARTYLDTFYDSVILKKKNNYLGRLLDDIVYTFDKGFDTFSL